MSVLIHFSMTYSSIVLRQQICLRRKGISCIIIGKINFMHFASPCYLQGKDRVTHGRPGVRANHFLLMTIPFSDSPYSVLWNLNIRHEVNSPCQLKISLLNQKTIYFRYFSAKQLQHKIFIPREVCNSKHCQSNSGQEGPQEASGPTFCLKQAQL